MPAPIPPPRESGFTRTTPVPLYWAAYGPRGAPRLLLLHGGPGAHHDYMLPQMLALADEFELIFYDQRGGGRSRTDSSAPIAWRTHVEDLALVVRELQTEPLRIIGYSWGGLLALLYAMEAGAPPAESGSAAADAGRGAQAAGDARSAGGLLPPELMVLIDPAPVTRANRALFEAEFARRQNGPEIRALREELAASGLRERDMDAYRQRLFELGVAGYFADPRRAHDLTPFRVMGRVQQSVWESLGDYDLRPRLGAIRAPTLVIHGREDPIPLASSEEIASLLPHAELAVLEGAGHVPYVEAEVALVHTVRRFVEAWSHQTPAPG